MNNKDLKIYFKFFFLDINSTLAKPNLELFSTEHFEEIRQRGFQLFFLFFTFVCIAFTYVKTIITILELPVKNIRFFQLSPGEYFISTLKIAFYTGLVLSIPLILSQILLFFVPGLNAFEKKTTIILICVSIILFLFGLNFSYFVLIPAALKFFINYGFEIIEPIWSFNQYFGFTSVLFFSTALIFQVPIIQIILSLIGIINPKQMLKVLKYVALASTIIGAILTPSIDPTTQLLLSGALFLLYLCGAYMSLFLTQTNLLK